MGVVILSTLVLMASVLVAFVLPPEWSIPAEALLFAGYFGVVARGIFSVRSSLVERTTWRSDDADETRVALTFDDGPHALFTPRILATLSERGIKATFFLIGRNVRLHPDLARRIVEEGHEVACHSDSHSRWSPWFRPSRLEQELLECLDVIRKAASLTPRFYRPPFGIRSPANSGVAARNDLIVIGMARRGMDKARSASAQGVAERTVARARGGEILALHDGDEPGSVRATCPAADALPAILEGLAKRGLTPVTVSTLLAERPYRESPARAWTGRSRGGRWGNAFFVSLVRLGGGTLATPFLVPVAAWFLVAGGKARRASVELRRRLHGQGNWLVEAWWAFRHFLVFGRTLLSRLEFVRRGARVSHHIHFGYEDARDVVEQPGGILIVSAHFGDWAAISNRLRGAERKLWIVAMKGVGLGPHQVRRDVREPTYEIIDVEDPPLTVAMQIAAALRCGDAVAVLGDRVLASDGVRVPFLGSDALFPTGVWTVAMVTGAPAIVVFGVPQGRAGTKIYVHRPVRLPRASGSERDAILREATAQFARWLEQCVRRHPFHWANFYDFWKQP